MALIARYFYFDDNSNLHLYNIKPSIIKETKKPEDSNEENETENTIDEIDYIKHATDDEIIEIYKNLSNRKNDFSLKERHEFNKRLVNVHKIDNFSLEKSLNINNENIEIDSKIKEEDEKIVNIVHEYINKLPTEPAPYESPFLRKLKEDNENSEKSDKTNNDDKDNETNIMKELKNFGHYSLPKLDEFDNLFTYMIFKNDVQSLMQSVEYSLDSKLPGQAGDFEFLKIPNGILLLKERNIGNSIPLVIHDSIAQDFVNIYTTKVELEES